MYMLLSPRVQTLLKTISKLIEQILHELENMFAYSLLAADTIKYTMFSVSPRLYALKFRAAASDNCEHKSTDRKLYKNLTKQLEM